jgi:hydroxymethylpyrimidine pyrophosphatase-like HAD family hydrolase
VSLTIAPEANAGPPAPFHAASHARQYRLLRTAEGTVCAAGPCDLLAIDLDGTLLDSSHRLPLENRAALHAAHAAGIRIVLCTGRSFPETRPILDEIGLDLDATVTVFGAVLTDVRTGRTLERLAFELPLAYRLTDWFRQRGYAVLWLNDADEAGFDGYVIDGPRRHPAVDRWVQYTPCRVLCVENIAGDVYPPVRISIIDELDVLEELNPEVHREFDGQIAYNLLRAPAYSLTIIEAFAPQANKWYGIQRLCQRWGIDTARTVAVGDDINDLAMVRHAGLGVAMANAHPEVRRAARLVVGHNDCCGVAELIDGLLDGARRSTC